MTVRSANLHMCSVETYRKKSQQVDSNLTVGASFQNILILTRQKYKTKERERERTAVEPEEKNLSSKTEKNREETNDTTEMQGAVGLRC